MHFLTVLAFLFVVVTAGATDPDPKDNKWVFCKTSNPPSKPEDVKARQDSGDCWVVYGISYNGCYTFPTGYGFVDQSLRTLTTGLACALYTDTKCKKDDTGSRYEYTISDAQRKSFKCHCVGRIVNGVCTDDSDPGNAP